MPKFIAVHTLPVDETQFKTMMSETASTHKIPAGFNYKQTYCDFTGHKFFCDWEAPGKEALEQVFQTIGMPWDSIHLVKVFNPATGKLE
jgi:hypothetical protein